MKSLTYRHTIASCCIGYAVQAIAINLAPLLFLTFESSFGFSTAQIAFLITATFSFQLVIDLLSSGVVRRLGLRRCFVFAHLMAAVGLCGMTLFPLVLPAYPGMLLAVLFYAVGCGFIEVVASPVVEACPTKNKPAVMSLLHSFYCWGNALTVLLSTLFFVVAGLQNWRILPCLWALVPLLNLLLVCRVPLYSIPGDEPGGTGFPLKALLSRRVFWILVLLMLCAGAAEQGMAQWASAFAEAALHVSKTVGDLAGPCAFALLEGMARLLYSRLGNRLPLRSCMIGCTVLCIVSYLLASLTDTALFGLIGCALCGFSTGILWPGSLSIGARAIPTGGTMLFGLLALSGDFGCIAGPNLVSLVTDLSGRMKIGLLAVVVFPLVLVVCLLLLKERPAASPPPRDTQLTANPDFEKAE